MKYINWRGLPCGTPKKPIPKVGGLPSHASRSHTIPWKLRRPVYSTRTLRLPRTPLSLRSRSDRGISSDPALRTTQTRSSCTSSASFRAHNSPTQCASSYKCLSLQTSRQTPTLLRASISLPPLPLLPSLVAPIYDFYPPVCCLPQANSSPHPQCPSSPPLVLL